MTGDVGAGEEAKSIPGTATPGNSTNYTIRYLTLPSGTNYPIQTITPQVGTNYILRTIPDAPLPKLRNKNSWKENLPETSSPQLIKPIPNADSVPRFRLRTNALPTAKKSVISS